MDDPNGLICSYILDGQGGGREVFWSDIASWQPDQGILWVHLDRSGQDSAQWLRDESGVDPIIVDALLADDIRPRVLRQGDDLLVNLRGVNLNPGAEPEDMVGIRMWLSPTRIITSRHRRLATVKDIRDALAAGRGPRNTGDFLASMADGLIERMGAVVTELDDQVDDLEEKMLTEQSANLRANLSDIRKTAITLRRYLAPQREAMSRLLAERTSWLGEREVMRLREVADRLTRHVEDLDAARERAVVTQEELNTRLNERTNKTLYVLTVVSAVLLPPTLLSGLMGINVGGMPGVESSYGFLIVVLISVVLGVAGFVLLRRLRVI